MMSASFRLFTWSFIKPGHIIFAKGVGNALVVRYVLALLDSIRTFANGINMSALALFVTWSKIIIPTTERSRHALRF